MQTDSLQLLNRAMDAYSMRLKALASNLANLDTPDYQRLSVSFEDELQQARRHTNGIQSSEAIVPELKVEDAQPVLEQEMMALADTQMRTHLVTRALHEHFARLRTGITGRPG